MSCAEKALHFCTFWSKILKAGFLCLSKIVSLSWGKWPSHFATASHKLISSARSTFWNLLLSLLITTAISESITKLEGILLLSNIWLDTQGGAHRNSNLFINTFKPYYLEKSFVLWEDASPRSMVIYLLLRKMKSPFPAMWNSQLYLKKCCHVSLHCAKQRVIFNSDC